LSKPKKRGHPGNIKDKKCTFCELVTTRANIKRHEAKCVYNPAVKRFCAVCGTHLTSKWHTTTCSYSCSNIHKPRGYGVYWTDDKLNYRTICFRAHGKECIIKDCYENVIIAVHHFDGDAKNNAAGNLVPLCPTHHQYMHSRHSVLLEKEIKTYLFKFNRKKVPVGN